MLATTAEVLQVTGATVTDAQLATAQAIVSVFSGIDLDPARDLAAAGYLPRDRRLLKSAVIWQAAYVVKDPDVTTRAGNLTAANANGVSVSYDDTGSAGSILAPLAKLSLTRLSWRRSRAVSVVREAPRLWAVQTLTSDGSDADWRPLR